MINIEVEKKISIIFLYHTLISRIHLTLHFPAFLLQFYIPYFISSFNLLKLLPFNYLLMIMLEHNHLFQSFTMIMHKSDLVRAQSLAHNAMARFNQSHTHTHFD
jgi:hypothetical protein